MNPNTTIRPWILACGAQYGIRQAHDYRWPDADARQHEMYCTYRLVSSEPLQVGNQDMSTASSYTANWKGYQQWRTKVEINLYNSQNGLYELASFCVGVQHNHQIRAIFDGECEFVEGFVDNLTDPDDHEYNYHHRLTCYFYEFVQFELSETNAIVETLDVSDVVDVDIT